MSVAGRSAGANFSVSWSQVHGFTPNCGRVAVKRQSIAQSRPPSLLLQNVSDQTTELAIDRSRYRVTTINEAKRLAIG